MATSIVDLLQSNHWIDVRRGTRVIFINVNLYNPSLDLVLALRLNTEFFSSGGVATSIDTTIINVSSSKITDAFSVVVKVLLICLFLWRTITEINDLSWGQAYGLAKVIEEDDFGVYLTELTSRRPTQMVSEIIIKRQLFTFLKDSVQKRQRKWQRSRRKLWKKCCCFCGNNRFNKNLSDRSIENNSEIKKSSSLQEIDIFEEYRNYDVDGELEAMEAMEAMEENKELGYVSKKCLKLLSSVLSSAIAWICCGCCCGYAGGYKTLKFLVETRQQRQKCCTCCNNRIMHSVNVRVAVNNQGNGSTSGESESGTSSVDGTRATLFSVLFADNNNVSNSRLPTLTLSLWCVSLMKAKYFRNWWNFYEIAMIVGFWLWVGAEAQFIQIVNLAKKNIANAINIAARAPEMVPFVHLDHVAWHSTWAHDLMGALFIGVSIHSLKMLSQVPFGVGTKVTAITSIFVHSEIVPFYLVLAILLVSFTFGFFFAYGDEIGDFNDPSPSFKHLFAMTLLGAELPGSEEMEGSNIEFFFIATTIIILLMVVIMMNVFIAVVSEVYAKAQEESKATFDASLEYHIASTMHPKSATQAEITLMTHHWNDVLRRETEEVNDDNEPSTQADVKYILDLLLRTHGTLENVTNPMFGNAVCVGRSITREEDENGDDIPEVGGRIIGDGFFNHKTDHSQDRRHTYIHRKMTHVH